MDERRVFLTVDELTVLWREMSTAEQVRADVYIGVISSELRLRAKNIGKDLDQLAKSPDYLGVLKSVIADVAARMLMTSTTQEPMSQMSESAGGYTMSGTFLVPGGGLFIKRSELARLGLKRQVYGAVDVYA